MVRLDREIAMDPTTFETWLGEIAALTEPQRRRAWQALALSETADGGEIETRRFVDAVLAMQKTNRRSAARRRRSRGHRTQLARPVSPTLGNAASTELAVPIATTATSSAGVRPAICHATAAKPVGARSTR